VEVRRQDSQAGHRPRGRRMPAMLTSAALLLAAALGGGAGACTASSDDAGTCRTGGDCPSGVCEAGICQSADATTGSAGGDDGAGGGEGGSDGEGGETSSGGGSADGGGGPLCDSENDGEVRRDEVPLEAGYRASFLTSTTADFDSQGDTEGGERVWDFDVDFSGDHLVLSETLDPSEQWFGASFPDATYAARLRDATDLLGIFQATDDQLLLLGVASQDDGISRTELTYDPPVIVLDFPLEEGNEWSTTTTVSGLAEGIGVVYTEAYDNEVDARGTAKTPYGDFDVLRVRVDLTRTVGFLVTTQRTFAFVSECFGTVARVVSQENDTSAEFDDPSEVLRLSP
jgi:hypothetical protein